MIGVIIMAFIYGLLGVIAGFFVILLLLYIFIRNMLDKTGFHGKSLKTIYNEIKKSEHEEKLRNKQVSGMTKILLPVILKDFPDFNEKQFYMLAESSIRSILMAIEKKDNKYLKSDDYSLIREKISLQIADLIDNNITYKYDDIIFHKHAIKSYKKEKGIATLVISSSLEYYYKVINNSSVTYSNDYKKQTRYQITFIYIYDVKRAGFDIGILGINCPNCGSPINSLEQKSCSYCKSGLNIQVANLLKCWKIIEYKEDY